jgi:tetratricopeptide (TPR) repeat protein
VRPFVILLLAGALSSAFGETIVLKNGKRIFADAVRQSAAKLEYDIGDNTFAIPANLVERVQQGGSPVIAAPPKPIAEILGESTLPSSQSSALLRDGKPDPDYLARMDDGSDPERAAAAYNTVGRWEAQYGIPAQALRYFERALTLTPQDATIRASYAAVLVNVGRSAEAITQAERATQTSPNQPDAYIVLGYAYSTANRPLEAARAWRRAVQLRPDPNVQALLDKAEKEVAVSSDYSQQESAHFSIHYEGRRVAPEFTRQIVSTLESQYEELTSDFGSAPRTDIAVYLYTEREFFDITHAPSWISAINDGKLRIPVEGLTSVSPQLSRVLKHELAHSFVNSLSHARCPTWLNEGLAQMLEPRSASEYGASLARLYQNKQQLPISALQGSFMQLADRQGALAYTQSLVAVEYINETYGMSDLVRMLERMGEGSSPEAALRATIHSGYDQLDQELAQYVARKYGN